MAGLTYSTEEEYERVGLEQAEMLRQRIRDRYKDRAEMPVWARKSVSNLDIDEETREILQEFVEAFTTGKRGGKGLFLYGLPGRGKTSMACAVLNDILQQTSHELLGWEQGKGRAKRPGFYVSYGDLLTMHGRSFRDDDYAALLDDMFGVSRDKNRHVRVLVIDDVGKEHDGGSGFNSATLHRLLRGRFDRGYPTLITTNLSIRPRKDTKGNPMVSTWQERYDEAMQSFVAGHAFDRVRAEGGDRRK